MSDVKPHPEAEKRFRPFFERITAADNQKIHSIHMTGSALTPDYDPKHSDINSVSVLKAMDLQFLEMLAPLGRKFGKKKIAAPLIMTPDYVIQSLDVFPIEFLDIHLLHHTWMGEDIFGDIQIDPSDLRRQCERELKIKLIGLRQGYISAVGNRKRLSEIFIQSFSGYIPLFRGIIMLYGNKPPLPIADVLAETEAATGVGLDPFHAVWRLKQERTRLGMEQLNTFFEDCYGTVEKMGDVVNALEP